MFSFKPIRAKIVPYHYLFYSSLTFGQKLREHSTLNAPDKVIKEKFTQPVCQSLIVCQVFLFCTYNSKK